MRKKKLLLNTVTAIFNQLVTLICGFVLPRMIISYYGSSVNGLISSITQFLAFFSMMEMGVGAVVRASLYKPLAEQDNDMISAVLVSSKIFFSKIGGLLTLYTIVLMILFPLFVDHSIGVFSTVVLVGAVAFSSICKYMFGLVYMQLLSADQKSYIHNVAAAVTLILNTVFSVVLIKNNASIEAVKVCAALVLLLKPLLLKLYVSKKYDLNFKIKVTEEPLKQKWNGFAQHIATYILKHADTVVLTFLSTLENVSIYYVYHLVTNGLMQIIEIASNGFSALLGDMYARNEKEKLIETFSGFEWLMHTAAVFVYAVAGRLIIPFVSVYTKGVTDTNYIVPVFAAIIVFANAWYCLRLPYIVMVNAAGHFKETQASAIVEAVLNVVVSVVLVFRFGLVGVAVGTLIAMGYRTCYMAWYLTNNILYRKLTYFLKHLLIDAASALLILLCTAKFEMATVTYIGWAFMAIQVAFVAGVIIAIINLLFYRGEVNNIIDRLIGRKKK